MNENEWIREFPAAVTVCDEEGIILEMNDKSAKIFEKDGGRKLIASNMLDCHPEPARAKTERLLAAREKNVYTIEKNGVKKLIYTALGHKFRFSEGGKHNLRPWVLYQSPWYLNGEYAGFVELSLEIPLELPHFIRS